MSAIRYRYRAALGRGGFSGKARRNRDRSRAERFDAQLMLDEYAARVDEAEVGDRIIPIGARSEFLPSVGESDAEPESDVPRRPFDRPDAATHEDQEAQPQRAGNRPVVPRPAPRDSASGHANRGNGSGPTPSEAQSLPRVISTRPSPRPEAPTRAEGPSPPTLAGRATGVLFGCAIGSAAAAMLLLALRAALP